ncbi:MAG: TolC family protein [Paucibacter sp.]|nr:TolC family protein [Roseateles sp.]
MRQTLLLAPLLLGACALAPIEPPATPATPATWDLAAGAGESAAESAAWAPVLDPTLRGLLDKAQEANTDIRRAALAFQSAQLQARQQGLRLQPSANFSYSANRPLESQRATVNVNGVLVPVSQDSGWSHGYSASVGAGFELDLWNRLAQLDLQQLALSEAARSDIAAARQSIAGRVAESYWTLAANERLVQLASEKLRLAEEALPLVTARVREGKLVPLEIPKAAAAVQTAQQQLSSNQASAAKARLALAQLLDQPPPGPAVPAAALPSSVPQWAPDEPARVLERRPDVHRARLEVDAALAAARATRASRYPQLTFSADVGTGGSTLSHWFSQPLLSLASGLSIPLIDWRRLDLQDAQSRNALEQSALHLRDQVFSALTEVQGLLIDQRRITESRLAAEQQQAQAREAARIAGVQLEVGRIARADELQARIAALDTEQALIQAQLDAMLNRLALLRALAVPVS